MPSTTRRKETQPHATTDDLALLQAAMGSGRQIAGGITHDLNSALQCLGDALFAIREDIQTAMDRGAESGDLSMATLGPSLRVADDAFHRLANTALTIPTLIPRLVEETGPISLGAELVGLVALTSHRWRNRVQVLVEVDPTVSPFWCTWWVARLAALRLLLNGIEALRGRTVPSGQETPCLRLVGSQQAEIVELRLCVERNGAVVSDLEDLDPTLVVCAKRLGGDVGTIANAAGGIETVFRFPVHRTPSTGSPLAAR